MTHDRANRVYFGDCRESMRELIAQGVKVQMCVTSPPYWGLRDYGHPGQLGLEATPDEYVRNMVEVFGLVRDLLADDGVLWLNLGDTYSSGNCTAGGSDKQRSNAGANVSGPRENCGLTPKNLIGIPWRVAFALQADGWWLRQDIIWSKPNPMPESVRDRCTKSHEYIFMLTKRERYYFDNEAISEPCSDDMQRRAAAGHTRGARGKTDASRCDADTLRGEHAKVIDVSQGRNKRSVWVVPTSPYSGAHFATFPPALIEPCILATSRPGDIVLDPFFGSGTTGQVAQNLGRRWIGCELNQAYSDLQLARTAQTGMVFA